jgi:hypothetical protein
MKQQLDITLTLGSDDMSWALTINGETFDGLTTEEAHRHVTASLNLAMDEVITEVTR